MITTIREENKKVRCFFTNKNEFKQLRSQWKKLGLTYHVTWVIRKRGDYEVLINFN